METVDILGFRAKVARTFRERASGLIGTKSLEDAQSKYHLALAKLGVEPGAQNVAVPARELAKLANIPGAPSSATLAQA